VAALAPRASVEEIPGGSHALVYTRPRPLARAITSFVEREIGEREIGHLAQSADASPRPAR
jgi:hypothetical protein